MALNGTDWMWFESAKFMTPYLSLKQGIIRQRVRLIVETFEPSNGNHSIHTQDIIVGNKLNDMFNLSWQKHSLGKRVQ